MSAAEDEDTLTGDFGSMIRSNPRTVWDPRTGDNWLWRVNYRRLRGRGPSSTERLVGADGVLQLTVAYGSRVAVKGLLFQAKKSWDRDPRLPEQCAKLKPWEQAAVLFDYRPHKYDVFTLDQVQRSNGLRKMAGPPVSMPELLSNVFLACKRGAFGLYYHPFNRELFWPTSRGLVRVPFKVKHQATIEVGYESLDDNLFPQVPALEAPQDYFMEFPLIQAQGEPYPENLYYSQQTR